MDLLQLDGQNDISTRPLVLIIDDSQLNQRILQALLADLADTLCAGDGESGLQLARSKRPDLILLDVEMPGMDGYAVCRALKDSELTAESSVIFVTSHNDTEHELAALSAGAVDFVSKPFNQAVVRARVQTHLTLQRQTQFLRGLASRDGLTGTYNRRYFDQQWQTEYRRHYRQGESLGLALIDIDYFKLVNDTQGHAAGDDVLRLVARCLIQSLRRPAEFIARYGGEEFAAVLPCCTAEEVLATGDWLRQQVQSLQLPHQSPTGLGVVSISVGVFAAKPSDALPAGAYLQAADHALYEAKQQGRNRVIAGASLTG
ncbi:diguanylate cyclase [Chitinilyticum piscinae]|uniref:diguanylate cyclase n=1 Tax=Chitinilyticum piscinae TaxID=2866724 RepID=A0A8J7G266_9NEIS|nr:diguanylate cyclase [Chitinilyticum piscinae]MBE9610595.1 diguanylate cyclase [Chitinilyticum piscinae]